MNRVETVLCMPESMNGELTPPTEDSRWTIVSVSVGQRQFPDDPQSPVWFTIAWAIR